VKEKAPSELCRQNVPNWRRERKLNSPDGGGCHSRHVRGEIVYYGKRKKEAVLCGEANLKKGGDLNWGGKKEKLGRKTLRPVGLDRSTRKNTMKGEKR